MRHNKQLKNFRVQFQKNQLSPRLKKAILSSVSKAREPFKTVTRS